MTLAMPLATPLAIAAGIDAGQRFLDVAVAPDGPTFRTPNTIAGIAQCLDRLRQAGAQRVVLEAIGVYAQRLVEALAAAGFEIAVVNPHRIKAFRAAEGRRAKTDRLDAQLIARFARAMTDAVRPLPSPAQQALKSLSLRRRQLGEMIAMEKTRLTQALDPMLVASGKRAIAALKEEADLIEAELARRIAEDPALARTLAILRSIPGIGARVATILVADLPELGKLDRKAIASLAGLAPHVSQSGAAPPRAAIAGGRPCVRAALYMAALAAARHDPRLRLSYQALRAQGKKPKVALIAIARKLVVLANALIRDDQPYAPQPLNP